MLSTAQINLYGRRWGDVCHSNDWRMQRGRLVPEARLKDSAWHTQVAQLARQHAQQNSRAINIEDLRRAMVHMITGKFCSSKDMTNAQFDRWLTLAKLLIDPTDLDAVMAWDDPKLAELDTLKWVIAHKWPDDYVRSIAGDIYGTRLWEDLELDQLRRLSRLLRARGAKILTEANKGNEDPF